MKDWKTRVAKCILALGIQPSELDNMNCIDLDFWCEIADHKIEGMKQAHGDK